MLFRPTGEIERRLIEESGWRRFPPRLEGQPIFYPVLNEEYATMIARRWNTKDGGVGYVLRFRVRSDFLSAYDIQVVGGRVCEEYWIPAEELDAFNDAIVGEIEEIAMYRTSDID